MNATEINPLKLTAIAVGLAIALGPLAALSFGSKLAGEETLERARIGLSTATRADPFAQYDVTRLPGAGLPKTLAEVTSGAAIFIQLNAAIEAAGVRGMLERDGPFTVFAPSNEAFASLPPEQVEALMADPQALQRVVAGHIVPGRLGASDLMQGRVPPTLAGQPLSVAVEGNLRVEGARVVHSIPTRNGVVHVIDRMLL
jgi:uncharacterized surface protein with fasciclin (FAS1) repeats